MVGCWISAELIGFTGCGLLEKKKRNKKSINQSWGNKVGEAETIVKVAMLMH